VLAWRRARQRLYESFIQQAGAGEAGELELLSGESARSVKVRLRRAAARLGAEVQIWDSNGRIYFMRGTRRGRSRKSRV
jgi:hypothetical protein